MDPITTAVPEQPGAQQPWLGLGFRMEAQGEPAAATAAGEGGDGGGQGDEGLGGLIDLSSYPEELHEALTGVAKQIQGNVTKRFQEHADFRKQWEPFEGVEGLKDTPPEQLSQLIQFAQIAGDPEQFDGWLADVVINDLAKESPERAEAFLDKLAEAGLIDGDDDDEGGGAEGLTPDSMRDMFKEMLDERLGPIEEHVTTTSMQGRQDAAKQEASAALDALEGEHGEFDRDAVSRLALTFTDAENAKDAIDAGYQEWLRITGKAEGALIDEKLGQPKPGVNGGRADTTPEQFSHDDPGLKDAMRARMRAG